MLTISAGVQLMWGYYSTVRCVHLFEHDSDCACVIIKPVLVFSALVADGLDCGLIEPGADRRPLIINGIVCAQESLDVFQIFSQRAAKTVPISRLF